MVLEQDTFILAIVLLQPRKTSPCLTERLLMGRKESNQTIKKHVNHMLLTLCAPYLVANSKTKTKYTVLSAKSDSDVMFCLQSYEEHMID